MASRRQELFKDHGTFGQWPHALGQLRLNPLYTVEAPGGDVVRLRRSYPSKAYVEEHSESSEYLPETVKVRSQTMRDLAEGHRTPEVEEMIAQVVALGMPNRYI